MNSAHETLQRQAKYVALISGLFGVGFIAAAALTAYSWRDALPNPVAVHWSASGAPNRLATLNGAIIPFLAIGIPAITLFSIMCWVMGNSALVRKILAALNVWFGSFLALILLVSLASQRGLADAIQSQFTSTMLGIPVIFSLVLAVIAWKFVPDDPPLPATTPIHSDAPLLNIGVGQRVVWHRYVTGGIGLIISGIIALSFILLSFYLRNWVFVLLALMLTLLLVAFSAFRVRIDESGLQVRTMLGWPRSHIPANEILGTSVIRVDPFRDFGGWGWRAGRSAPGQSRSGVVTRKGEALLVERTGGRRFVVTTDDAATAAALLNTVAARSR